MATLVKSIFIQAPVEKVFAYASDPTHTPEYWPSMLDVRNVKDPGNGLKTYEWTYKMAGARFEGTSEVIEFVPNERLVTVSKGGIESKISWIFTPAQGGTEWLSRTEYTVPVPVLGRLAEGLIQKQNEREAETLMANLKALMETPEPMEKL